MYLDVHLPTKQNQQNSLTTVFFFSTIFFFNKVKCHNFVSTCTHLKMYPQCQSELCSIFQNTWPPHIRTWPYGSLQNQTTKPRCARSLSLGKNTISYLDSALCFGGLKLPRIFLFLFFVLPEPPAWNAFQLFTLFCRDSWNKKLSNTINYQLHNEGPIPWR